MNGTSSSAWADFRPIEPTHAERAFGPMGNDFRRFAPMYVGYHKHAVPDYPSRRMWEAVVSQWFYSGLTSGDEFAPKGGIDMRIALQHVGAVLRSFEPDHNSKERIAAYLLSLWFDDFTPSKSHSKRFRDEVASTRLAAEIQEGR